ncbi:MAG TPA: glycosyltransferase family 9 protein [Parafilimonas sp.]|nr:glycosyltransferase family 9 protein [Parafilimonas sp.]
MSRFFSVLIRRIKSRKKEQKLLKQFHTWKNTLHLQKNNNSSNKILIIRLDDIGDYILFRNFLGYYKNAERWKNYSFTLLGNIVWKELFEKFDKDKVDLVIWIDKKQYLTNESYREKIWSELNEKKFAVVICPSRTRPLLLDDLCAIATGAKTMIAAENNFVYDSWNQLSNSFYNELFPADNLTHEFNFNRSFAEWCCKQNISITKPEINIDKSETANIICFIGASAKSKRWIAQRWIELINMIKKENKYNIFVAGGNSDVIMAEKIVADTGVNNIAGKTSLNEMIEMIANAKAIITNDTMATHAAVACNTPLIILANGNNYYRFTDYSSFNLQNVITMYPERFSKKLKDQKNNLLHYEAVSSDIQTISAEAVYKSLQKILS